ncbi:MAG: DUF3887 domain-containing protein [Ktedonobacteraceae bacterium]
MRISKIVPTYLLFVSTLLGCTVVLGANGASTKNDHVAKAEAFVHTLAKGDFTLAEANFTDQMKAGLPPAKLQTVWNELTVQGGAYERTRNIKTIIQGDYTTIVVNTEFKNGSVGFAVTFHKTGKIGGLHVVPAS